MWRENHSDQEASTRSLFADRVDCVPGFERHTIRGLKKMTTKVALALIVLLAMALGRVMANQAELMRSLTAPVKRAA